MDRNNRKRPPILTNPHSLLHWEQPVIFLRRVLRVYPQEVKLLVWVTLIQLMMRVSTVLVNNFAQTAFLKRFGVEHLPTIFMIEALLTFFIASFVGILMDRFKTLRVFTGLILFYALAVLVIRGLLPLNFILIYPVLFILKSQAIEVLPILYWDILSDLFTTQQSKRLYTLITAGGVLGSTIGSILTGPVARWVGIDNVLLIFVAGMVLTAFLNEFTERVAGAPIETRTDSRKEEKRGRFQEDLKQFFLFAKQSPLLKYMILIITIPNMLLPILDYQFNVVVDDFYATEQGTLQFFGIYRGISNATMFILLLFSSRLVTRWGVATSLLFHPVNYLIAFVGLLFRFDFFMALYARFSTETLKTTLNNPARAVLYNFFPPAMRGLIRVFLRGTVVRASDFTGSGLLILLRGLMAPRLLSLLAAPMALVWIYTTFRIKKHYAQMVFQTLTDRQIDWKRLEDEDFPAWLQDRRTIETLQQGLKHEDPRISRTCGEILSRTAPPGWAEWVVEASAEKPIETRKALMDLLKIEDAERVRETLIRMTETASPETLALILSTLRRIDPEGSPQVVAAFLDHRDRRVRSEAMAGLFLSHDTRAREQFERRIEQMLQGDEIDMRAAAEVLGKTGDPSFAHVLLHWIDGVDAGLRTWALHGLARMGHDKALDYARKAVEVPDGASRTTAMEIMIELGDKTPTDLWIRLLGDEDPKIREKASLAIMQRRPDVVEHLIPALSLPSRLVRSEILSILESLGAPSLKLSEFIMVELKKAYRCLAQVEALKTSENERSISLLIEHLLETKDEIVAVVLRVIGVMEFGDRMRIILKAIQSREKRDTDNAVEVLETSLHSDIRKVLIPLLEERPLEEKIAIGRKRLEIKVPRESQITLCLVDLLKSNDETTQTLALYALGEIRAAGQAIDAVQGYVDDEHWMVKEAALWASYQMEPVGAPGEDPLKRSTLVDKGLHLRKIPLFAGLGVQEILAIAFKTRTRLLSKGEVLVREGGPGDALFLVLDGELIVIKAAGTAREVALGQMGRDDFLGEMALIDRMPRSATVRAVSDCRLLVLDAEEFDRIMRDYYTIPLNICKVMSQRLRILQKRLQASGVKAKDPSRRFQMV